MTLRGRVVRGDGLGAKLGFPTANLAYEGPAPEKGVWIVEVAGASASNLRAVCNVGVRPTVAESGGIVVEVHIPSFAADLYGKTLEVKFIRKLRDEKKFASLEALRAQIAEDVAQALTQLKW